MASLERGLFQLSDLAQKGAMDVILIECVVKGYRECGYTVTTTIKSTLILPVASVNEGAMTSSQILTKREVQGEVLR